MSRCLKSALAGTLIGLINTSAAIAATYHLSSSGQDSHSCAAAQTAAAAKKTFQSAWGCLRAGDTLLVADGVYRDAQPPVGKSGAAGAPITLRAITDGGAKISTDMIFRGNSYLTLQGFKVTGESSAIELFSRGPGKPSHHLTFQRLAFTCTDTVRNDNACFNITDGAHHILVEDFWGWGGGRYTMMLYGGAGGNQPNTTADHNTLRRGVLRMGPSTSSRGNPQAGLAVYYASNNVIENVIVLDSQTNSDSSNAAFYLTAHSPPPQVSGNKYYGLIALNNLGYGWYLDQNGIGSNNEVHHSVFWDSDSAGIQVYGKGTCIGNLLNHVTVGSSDGNGIENYRCQSTSVKSSVVIRNTGHGLRNGSGGTMGAVGWNVIFDNSGGARREVPVGDGDRTVDPGLKYIARVESGSGAAGAGEAGSNAGADVTRRYRDGVLTTESLWPWPNEERIKRDMCTDAGVTRGFCASASLTEYIWSYLGNPNPYR